MTLSAEASIARLIAERHSFKPGGQLLHLVELYADIEYLRFPTNTVDGISLYLKSPDRRSNILINLGIPDARQRFTLAHEFGHVIIPWHSGMIFSNIDRISRNANSLYREMEAEANRFAAELLMPSDWIVKLFSESSDPTSVVEAVRTTCRTSNDAAVIAVNNALPAGFVYACTDLKKIVKRSSTTIGTRAPEFSLNDKLTESLHSKNCSKHFSYLDRDSEHHWFYFEPEINLEEDIDPRTWREIFSQILLEINITTSEATLKSRVNGIISAANHPKITAETFFANVRQRMLGRDPDITCVFEHPLFNLMLSKRVREFQSNR